MKKSVKILLILIIMIIILVPLIFIFKLPGESKCDKLVKKYNIFNLEFLKCRSLCPGEINTVKERWIIDKSCSYYCTEKHTPIIETEEQKGLFKCLQNNKQPNILSDMPKGCNLISINAKTCIGEWADSHKDIIDLSDYKLENYPIYDLTIEELDCSKYPLEVKVKLNQGKGEIELEAIIISEGNRDNAKSLGLIEVGQTKTYNIDYDQSRITQPDEFGIFLIINNKKSEILFAQKC